MKRILLILFIWFAILPLGAELVVATIKHYNEALLSGDVSDQMKVTFNNSSINTGTVGKDKEAVLTLSGIPRCTIDSIVLVMSQTNDAEATIKVSLGDTSWVVVDGAPFRDWPGVQESAVGEQNIFCLASPQSVDSAKLTITIIGVKSSVKLYRLMMAYTLPEKTPHSVTLNWLGGDYSWHQTQLMEDSAEMGVELPSVPTGDSAFTYQEQSWHWIGWCEQPLQLTEEEPIHWEAMDWYGPQEDVQLYALYTNATNYVLEQDTSFCSGEYALVCSDTKHTYAMAGNWENGHIQLQNIQTQQVDQINDSLRYQLTFTPDSVTIKNVATNSWIGYNKSSGSNNKKKWLWKRAAEGSIFICKDLIYYPESPYSPANSCGLSLVMSSQLDTDDMVVSLLNTIYEEQYVFWRLYPTEHIPSHSSAEYTTFSFFSGLISPPSQALHPTKLMHSNGRIILLKNNIKYNILGNQL